MAYILGLLKKHGIKDISVNLYGRLGDHIQHYLCGFHSSFCVGCSYEPYPRGTAGGIKALPSSWFLKNFIVLNGDTITNVDLTDMVKYHKKENNIATVFSHDTIIHNGGVFVFDREILEYIPENKIYSIHEDLLPDLIKKKIPISLYKSDAYSFDCGTLEKLEKARKFFKG